MRTAKTLIRLGGVTLLLLSCRGLFLQADCQQRLIRLRGWVACSKSLLGVHIILLFCCATVNITLYGPRQANLVLIAYASSEGSGEPEPPLLAHTSSESRGTLRQKARSLAPLNGWACAVTICHDGMLEDTDLLDAAHISFTYLLKRPT